MAEERLQKVLAAAGLGSRRYCETLISAGRVAVDGKIVTELGTKVDPDKVEVAVDGELIRRSSKLYYILLNKPVGYTSTRKDPHAEHTVLELVDGIDAYLYPVGRLDVDTSGLLILTNDGDLTKLLTHPSHEIEKTYLATVRGRISASDIELLEKGVELEDGITAPAKARLISYSPGTQTSRVQVTIHEGRKRQVRRMFAAVGHRVEVLSRIRLGSIDLKGLSEGRYRHLSAKEVTQLRKLAARGTGDRRQGRGRGGR